MKRFAISCLFASLTVFCPYLAAGCFAQAAVVQIEKPEDADDQSSIDSKKWGQAYLAIAKQFQLSAEDNQPIDLVPRSLLHWNNPVRVGRTEGDFFVWANEDGPVMVGTVFSYDSPVSQHAIRALAFELHTLSEATIVVNRQGQEIWSTPSNALEKIRLPDLSEPREQRFARLREMREIARGLVATTKLAGTDQPLRLLPNPIYRYELSENAQQKGLIDGAVFAMVTGTDPELLVFIEATRKNNAKAEWQLTPARFTNLPITLSLDGKVLWNNSASATRRSYRPYMDQHKIYQLPTALGSEAMERLK